MGRLKLSADVLKLNPDLAAAQAESKAKTPSGKGHGHTDDAQDYKGWQPIPASEHLKAETNHYLEMLRMYGGNSKAAGIVKAACRNLLESLRQS